MTHRNDVIRYEANGVGQCWTGSNMMTKKASASRGGCKPSPCVDSCYAKGVNIANVSIHEEKFIASNDVVSTTITASRPVMLQITGRSFASADNAAGRVLSLNGQCSIDKATNSVRIVEGGTVSAHVRSIYFPHSSFFIFSPSSSSPSFSPSPSILHLHLHLLLSFFLSLFLSFFGGSLYLELNVQLDWC